MASREVLCTLLKGKLDDEQVDALIAGEAAEFAVQDGSPPIALELLGDDTLALYAFLDSIPLEPAIARPYLMRALELNQPGFIDAGNVLAMHENEIVIRREIECASIDQAGAARIFDAFSLHAGHVAEHLAGYLNDLLHEDEGMATAASEAPPDLTSYNRGWVQA